MTMKGITYNDINYIFSTNIIVGFKSDLHGSFEERRNWKKKKSEAQKNWGIKVKKSKKIIYCYYGRKSKTKLQIYKFTNGPSYSSLREE